MNQRDVCVAMHTRLQKRWDACVPPELDAIEREDPHVQFVMHMRAFLARCGDRYGRLLRCDGAALGDRHYDKFTALARFYAVELACLLLHRGRMPLWQFCAFALAGLAGRVHGFFGHALVSLYATDSIDVVRPQGLQDPGAWQLLRVALTADVQRGLPTVAVLDVLNQRVCSATPGTLFAAVGFLALLVRSTTAANLLTSWRNHAKGHAAYLRCDARGLSPIFAAMLHCCEPHRQRTPIDVVLCTTTGSLAFGEHPELVAQFERLAVAWLDEPVVDVDPQQEFVHTSTREQRMASLHRLARCDPCQHCSAWMEMAARIAVRLESVRQQPADPLRTADRARAWVAIWHNLRTVFGMSRRLLTRRNCTPVVVVWTYAGDAIRCFARVVKPPPCDGWTTAYADDIETALRVGFSSAGTAPTVPDSRLQRRRATTFHTDPSRWDAPLVDEASAAPMALVRAVLAQEQAGGSAVLVAQSGFREASSVAVVCCRDIGWAPGSAML